MKLHARITSPVLSSLNRTGKGDWTEFEIELEQEGNPDLRVTLVITDPHEAGLLADALAEAAETIQYAAR